LYLNPQANPLVHSISISNKKSVKKIRDDKSSKIRSESKLLKQKSNPTSLSLDLVTSALTMLNNNALRISETKGTATEVRVIYPPEILAGVRGLFPAGRSYSFQMHAFGTFATVGGGVFSGTVDWSPSVTTFAEWTALAALFDEVKLVRSNLHLTSAFGPTSTAIIFQMVIAPEFGPSLAAAYTSVQRLAQSSYHHPVLDFKTKKISAKIPSRDWATTGTPAGTSGMIAGCLGRWVYASNIVGTASIAYYFHGLDNIVRFRMRA
jgi:hypothetical protein